MATTTPNFGWSVPTSSDLVKNGATAIETLGDSIDASLVDLKGGTTGQVLSKATNTDMDFTWATSASGGYTSLASGSLSGTSVALSSISSSYKDLQLVIKGATWGTGASAIRVQVNSITTGYQVVAALAAGSTGYTYALNGGSRWRMPTDATQDNTSDQNMYVFDIYDYTATNDTKLGSVDFAFITGGNPRVYAGAVALIGADAAISTLTISVESGATFNGGTYILYGVK